MEETAEAGHLACLLFSGLPSLLIKSLCKSAFLQESLFQLSKLLVKQVVRLMDQAHERVRGDSRFSFFNRGLIGPL